MMGREIASYVLAYRYNGNLETGDNNVFYDCTKRLIGLNTYFGEINGFVESFIGSLDGEEDTGEAINRSNVRFNDNKPREMHLAKKLSAISYVSVRGDRLRADLREINRTYRDLYDCLMDSYREHETNKKGFDEDLRERLGESRTLKKHVQSLAKKRGKSEDFILSEFVSNVLLQLGMIPDDVTDECRWNDQKYGDVCGRLDGLLSVGGFSDPNINRIVSNVYKPLTEQTLYDDVLKERFVRLNNSIDGLYRQIEKFDVRIGYTKQKIEEKNRELLKLESAEKRKKNASGNNAGINGTTYVAPPQPGEDKLPIKRNNTHLCA